jgi:hypothetical protein
VGWLNDVGAILARPLRVAAFAGATIKVFAAPVTGRVIAPGDESLATLGHSIRSESSRLIRCGVIVNRHFGHVLLSDASTFSRLIFRDPGIRCWSLYSMYCIEPLLQLLIFSLPIMAKRRVYKTTTIARAKGCGLKVPRRQKESLP